MVLRENRAKYWIDIYDDTREEGNNPDGFWVVFLRRNIELSKNDREHFLGEIWRLMGETGISFVRISRPYFERLIVFTSCNKHEIRKIKNALIRLLRVNVENLVWKAVFESEEGWKHGNWLDTLDTTFSMYESQLKKNNIELRASIIAHKSKVYQTYLEGIVMHRESMVVRPVFKPISYEEDGNFAFVLMPFGEKWSDDVYHLIRKTGIEANIDVKRADDFFEPNIIIDDIWNSLNKASIIIADISVHNANVFYELGIAHTLGKKVILLKQKNGIAAPFDVRDWRYIEYETTPKEADAFVEKLRKVLLAHKTDS